MRSSLSKMSCAAALAWAAVASAELVDRVAAVVNDEIITLSEVEARAAPELQRAGAERDGRKRAELRQTAMKNALDQLIGEKLLEAEMRELSIDVTESDLEAAIDDVRRQNNIDAEQFEQLLRSEGYTLQSYREFMRKHLRKAKLINLKVRSKVKVADEDLRAEYNKYAKLESEDAEIHARHILVKVAPNAKPDEVEKAKARAEALMNEARQPGVDFAELARNKSDGPSKADGGDLGFFRRGVMVPEFERTAFGLKPGQISQPVRTKFGWHVIKVEEKRAVSVKPFEEMKEQLRERLLRTQLEKYTDQYVQELRQSAVVEVKI